MLLFICLFICLFIYLFIYLSTFFFSVLSRCFLQLNTVAAGSELNRGYTYHYKSSFSYFIEPLIQEKQAAAFFQST